MNKNFFQPDSSHGDRFSVPPVLEPYARTLEPQGIFYYEARNPTHSSVLLIHGNGDEADTWRHVLPALSQTHHVLALDLPGFGRSKPRSSGGFSDLVESVSSFIVALSLERVHLVGSSLGAAIAGSVAVQLPDKISSVTLVDGVPPGFVGLEHAPQVGPLLEQGIGEGYYTGLREAGQDAAYRTLEPYYASLTGMPQEDHAFLRERVWARVWSDTQRAAFFASLRSLVVASPLELNTLENIPLLLVWGEQDLIWPMGAALETLNRFPKAKLERIPHAGHLPHQEQPEAFVRVLEGFLGELD